MGYTTQLLDGLAAHIADAGLAVYRPDGVYEDDETGVIFTVVPESPDRVIVLTAYPVEDTELSDAITGIQARMRCGRDPREVDDLADDLRDLLHNAEGLVLGGVRVSLIWRQSQALLGQDAHGRIELSANYYARTTRPSPHLYE